MQFLIKDLTQDILCLTVFDRDFFSPDGGSNLTLLKPSHIETINFYRVSRPDGDPSERHRGRVRGQARPRHEDTQAPGGRVRGHLSQARHSAVLTFQTI